MEKMDINDSTAEQLDVIAGMARTCASAATVGIGTTTVKPRG
jgi:hypothetical protein